MRLPPEVGASHTTLPPGRLTRPCACWPADDPSESPAASAGTGTPCSRSAACTGRCRRAAYGFCGSPGARFPGATRPQVTGQTRADDRTAGDKLEQLVVTTGEGLRFGSVGALHVRGLVRSE